MSSRARIALVLGVVMIALGAFVGGRVLAGAAPLTPSALLDGVFAFFFVARGALNIRAARRVDAYDRERLRREEGEDAG